MLRFTEVYAVNIISCIGIVKVGQYNLKTGLDISTSNVEYPTKEEIVSSCPNEQACQGCFDIESKDIAKR